ncbi:hypothetical protein CDD83_7113 [Cordyceps sp. RAO-2017]|nr:hypothetical protein CDD83_7113 [Cordyceps sp. RAO-2017]
MEDCAVETGKISPEQVRVIFEPLGRGDAAAFFEHVEDDVLWIVKGTFLQIAGHYESKAALRSGTKVLNDIWATPLKLAVQHVVCDGADAVVEMKADDTRCKNGMHFSNEYVWVCHFNDRGKIERVRAYMDT